MGLHKIIIGIKERERQLFVAPVAGEACFIINFAGNGSMFSLV